MYRGLTASALRDIPGWAIYFAAYEWLKVKGDEMNERHPVSDKHQRWRDFLWRMNAGGTAGVISWIACLPQDILKSKQQAHMGSEPLRLKQAWA
jgi:solute carrier family 25 (mitochondrial carnitine/acylcarnitine transporter), member 20/29